MVAPSYSRAVLERFDRPSRAGPPGEDAAGVGRAGSAAAGAMVEISLEVDGDRITAARFRAFGCPHTIAAASKLVEQIEGQAVEAIVTPRATALAAELEAPATKLGRLLIVDDALAAAVADWRRQSAARTARA